MAENDYADAVTYLATAESDLEFQGGNHCSMLGFSLM